jgi:hypothetical protein
MTDVNSHGTENLVEKIFLLHQQLESTNQKYEDLQSLYSDTVKTNYKLKTEYFLLKDENDGLNDLMKQREQFYKSQCLKLESQHDRLQVRYRDLRDNYYKEKNAHGDYGFDLTGDVTAKDRNLSGQASHREVSPYKVK